MLKKHPEDEGCFFVIPRKAVYNCRMTRELIDQIQKKIVHLLKKVGDRPLPVLVQKYCDEIVHLAGNWILDELPTARIYIVKGIIDRHTHHDLLIVEYGGKAYVIDPAVWRFFKGKKTILMTTKHTMPEALIEIQKLYHGIWRISERMEKSGFERRHEWERRVEIKVDEAMHDMAS
ncbi:hypothetical protein A2524_00330 [Candidatus Wolfebacteria bacterium RIFOXYD12_FULL_48_21]|uniref:Uncharacterized protein n=1 Tax=Candidatus Wolfebacteria bacterium RIFOXYD1_FULL_48_65 TaxID=1802561 RepID=A0A1F8E1H9_9BACT|nr:MAG: hypothetical protein A2610_01505 [Candidatus Wolfebacteria bacterium RIFOXYD1_FULL_48_65]OGM94889.1 MAG: hypothetical protein A2524_00330 [Candidatus Wolfebacteria bacterium RIFOXYD12_FULL_48_21]OGM97308.1 MAG: hypothetical protein A2532_02070 [Candidatus Wolfebacteria bacterium RIFOXYD2_FULL_48_11]